MTTALSEGLTARMRSRWASTASTAETAPARTAAAVSTADHCQICPLGLRVAADGRGAAFLAATLAAFVVDFLATFFFETSIFITTFLATSHLLQLCGTRLRATKGRVQPRRRPSGEENAADRGTNLRWFKQEALPKRGYPQCKCTMRGKSTLRQRPVQLKSTNDEPSSGRIPQPRSPFTAAQ